MREEMRTFGYLCPKCGKTVMAARSVFALEASNAEVECEGGDSALRVEFDGERYRVFVPCGICGETHVATCRPEQLLEGPGVGLACTRTGQLCCYVGTASHFCSFAVGCCFFLRCFIIIGFTIQHHDNIGILFNRTGFTQV